MIKDSTTALRNGAALEIAGLHICYDSSWNLKLIISIIFFSSHDGSETDANMNRPRKLSKIMLGQSGKVDPTLKSDEEKKTVLVFGATGMVGGAVARALLSYPWFRVHVATRRPWCTDAMLLNRAGNFFYKTNHFILSLLWFAIRGDALVIV